MRTKATWSFVWLIMLLMGYVACDDHATEGLSDDMVDAPADSVADAADTPGDHGVDADEDAPVDLLTDTSPPDAGDASVDSTADVGPDVVNPQAAICELSFFHDTSAEPISSCAFSPLTVLGCDAVARCVCEHYAAVHPVDETPDIEQCVSALVFPRGAISLADFCPYVGSTSEPPTVADIAAAVFNTSDGAFLLEGDASIVVSDACHQVAGFTLWGASAEWHLSMGVGGQPFPAGGHNVDEFPLYDPPMVSLEHVLWYTMADTTLRLTPAGAQHAEGTFAVNMPLGPDFLVHDGYTALARGLLMSWMISSTREGVVLVIEELEAMDYAVLAFGNGYPPQGPAPVDLFFSGSLAAARKVLDLPCLSTCGCPDGRICEGGVCVEAPPACRSDTDCCAGTCLAEGTCTPVAPWSP